jgi:Glycosyl transferase family 2
VTGIDLLLHPESNIHFHEIVEVLALALADIGADVAVIDDGSLPVDDARAIVALGPHEVYPRFRDLDHEWLARSLRRTVAVGTEQPGLTWFDTALPYQANAAAALDISRFGATEQRRHGVPAEHLQLGYHPSLDATTSGSADRPVDVLFLGNLTDRRARILGICADTLAPRSADLRVTHVDVSQRDRFSGFVGGEEKRRLLASSRMLLNIHRGDAAYFEWARALDALSNGTLLITEHSADFEPLEPGAHFLSVRPQDLPWALETALRDPAWVDDVRLAGQQFVKDALPLSITATRLAELAELVVRRARRSETDDRRTRPALPSHGHPPVSEVPIGIEIAPNWRERAALKRLTLDVMSLKRAVAGLAVDPDTPKVEEWNSPAWDTAEVDVTVVVTVYNYARFVFEAIDSVARSSGVSLEVVVVDDASTDNSNAIVRSVIDVHPGLPLVLLRHRVNSGLPVSRNLGFSRARSPFVFVLDADNLVYPNGIARLLRALEEDADAAFAYGLLQKFDDYGPTGVSGGLPWQPSQLARENYIDAMALVRLSTWERLGGYATDAALHGWEDYDFWLGCAAAGWHGAHVRQFVARYRSHQTSMLSVTDLETESTQALLRQRHSALYRSLERAT